MNKLHMTKKTIHYIAVILIGLLVGAGTQLVVFAWTAPGSTPPSPNVAAPINVSGTTQVKTGALGITGGTPTGSYGLVIGTGKHLITGGKAYSQSTVDADPNNTLVTKDYVLKQRIDSQCAWSRTGVMQNDSIKWCNATYPALVSCTTMDDEAPSTIQSVSGCSSDGECLLFKSTGTYPRGGLGGNHMYLERVQKSGGIQGCLQYDKEHSHLPYRLEVVCCKSPLGTF